MPVLQHKTCEAVDFKLYEPTDEAPNGSFSAYFSTFGNFDRVGEAVQPGAFKSTIPKFLQDGFIAIGHDWNGLPAAYPVKAVEDNVGLLVTGNFHSTMAGQEARTYVKERMAAGKSVKTSIGYRVVEDEQTKDGRLLKQLDLYEGSFVNVPANDKTYVVAAKNLDEDAIPGGQEKADEELAELNSYLLSTTVAKQFEVVCAANETFLKRLAAIKELRFKEGRPVSGANLARISQLRAFADQMLAICGELEAQAQPKTKPADSDEELTPEMAAGEDEKGLDATTATTEATTTTEGEQLGEEKQLTAHEQEAEAPTEKSDETAAPSTGELDAAELAEIELAEQLRAQILLEAALEGLSL
jgi:HK97 family phage prohead protease